VVLLVLAGCAHRRIDDDAHGRRSGEEGARHWIQDEKLREIMDKLVAGPSPDQDQAGLSDAANFASALSDATEGIRTAGRRHQMSDADWAAFEAQIDTLRDQAAALAKAARAADIDAMRRLVDQIDLTCNACHTRFRDYSGLLEPYRKAENTHRAPDSTEIRHADAAVGKRRRLP